MRDAPDGMLGGEEGDRSMFSDHVFVTKPPSNGRKMGQSRPLLSIA